MLFKVPLTLHMILEIFGGILRRNGFYEVPYESILANTLAILSDIGDIG